ncbi:response regulator [bacterium C-53]|nr:response regulator [Lachnospiraceae bacterium]NBI02561.1 response regulator [Lachnospiraceae bacterium]RKJ11646.1 response regulator [bacterium C-53]
MKNLRKLSGVMIFLILGFMVIALFQYQSEEDMSLLPDQFEIYLNENWTMALLDVPELSVLREEDDEKMQEAIESAAEEAEYREIELPYSGAGNASDLVVFKNVISQEYVGLTLGFSTSDSAVRVVLDGEEIYRHGISGDGASWHATGYYENLVTLPQMFEKGELQIELIPSYPDAALSFDNVKLESRDVVVIGLVGNNIADIGCCLLILIASIIMFVLALIRRYTGQPVRGEFFLGLAELTAGIYCFIGTDTLNIFYNVQEAYEMQEYLVLMIPLFLAMYFDRNLHVVYPRRFSALLWCVSLNAAVQILLQLTGIQKLENMMNVSAAVVGVVCVMAIMSLIEYDYRNKRYQTLLSVLSMLVLLAGGIVNVILNIVFEDVHANTAGQYSMTMFAIMMAVMHTLQISKEYRAGAEEKAKAAQQQNIQLAQAKKDADAARYEAQTANEAKGKFLAHMSHEIRTPINAVLGMDEMILRETKEQNIKEYAMDIYMAGQTLLSLINDILDFSKIESGKMEIVPVEYDISSLIHDLANMTSQRADSKNIRFLVEVDNEIPSRLYGDDVRIRQVLTNILTNAVKYTHEGTVWLRVRWRKTDETAVLMFEVEDTGIGIKDEDLPKLFAEFERIEEDRNRNIEGSGLGMNITILLLSLLGSRLQVESTYGEGSKFYFELEQKIIDDTPIGDFEARVQQMAENYNYTTRFCAPEAKILVVDDNAVNRRVLKNLLKDTKIQITDAQSGAECLNLVLKNHYDLIFLDHMMPEMDGVETLHHIKEFSDYPCQNTPIVVLTANAVSGAKEKYMSEGFDDFLSKPVVPAKLETMIKKMLPAELVQDGVLEELPEAATLHGGMSVPEECVEKLPFVDGLDWQYAWMHLPDMELLKFTVKEFYAQIDSAADDLKQAYERIMEKEQLEKYRIQVHAMKSLAASVGILPVSGVAKILEYAAKDGRIDVIMAVTEPFLEEWCSYREKLKGVFGIGTDERKEVTDYSVIKALVDMVRLSMQEMDIDEADRLTGQLKTYKYPDEMEQNIQELAKAVTNLNPEEADRLADLLIGQMEGRSGIGG